MHMIHRHVNFVWFAINKLLKWTTFKTVMNTITHLPKKKKIRTQCTTKSEKLMHSGIVRKQRKEREWHAFFFTTSE